MNALRALKRLVLGDTWALPIGIAAVLLLAGLVVRPLLATDTWSTVGGFVVLAGVVGVLLAAVRSSVRGP